MFRDISERNILDLPRTILQRTCLMKLSIALTTYNGASYLAAQLDSFYRQSYQDFEVVAVDDASTDETAQILRQYSERYGLRYYINHERLGFIRNFEKAISLCSGDYIALSDHDDIWLPDKLSIQLEEIGSYSLVCSDVKLIDDQENVITDSMQRRLHTPVPNEQNQFYSEVFINCVRGCTILFKKELLTTALPIPDTAISHDWWLGVCATLRDGFKYLDKPLVLYRVHAGNAVGINQTWKLSDFVRYVFSQSRKDVFKSERERIKTYLDQGLYNTDEQHRYLQRIYEHYDSIVTTRIHIKAFRIVFGYRNYLFNNIGFIPKIIHLLGRLI